MISKNVISVENRILFKINQKAFTSFDLENRIKYLNFIGDNDDLNKDMILKDFISANLFFEYYELSKKRIDHSPKINEIYKNVLKTNQKNKKKFGFEINEKNILKNIKIDYIRKITLEYFLNSNLDNLKTSDAEIDLLYSLKIKYINFNLINNIEIYDEINKLKSINYNSVKNLLFQKNIDFFTKEQEVSKINNIDKRIRDNIILNNNYFVMNEQNRFSYIFIERNFETYSGITANIYSVKSRDELTNDYLKCDNLINIKSAPNIINKDYKFSNLNNDIKNNLKNINDYIKIVSNNENIYIVLCNLRYDLDILKNINLNKEINTNVKEIESKFINKYSKIFNLIMIDA